VSENVYDYQNSEILVVEKYNLKAFVKAFQPTGEASRLPQEDIQHIKKQEISLFFGGNFAFLDPDPDSQFGSTSPGVSGVRIRNIYYIITFHAETEYTVLR
jgi:hypothetical protein